MRYCKHTQWLGLAVNDGDVVLQNTDRLETLLEDLPDPDEQSPSLFVFIGNRSKAMAIKELAKTFSPPPDYGHDTRRRSQHDDELNRRGRSKLNGRRTHGEIHLHIHPPSTFSSKPVLLAEGDLPSLDRSRLLAIEKCHETANRLMDAGALITPTLSECADRLYFKLLSPFADVFCFFADDVGGLRPIVQRLAIWLDLGQPSTLPESTRPKIIIVIERDGDDYNGDELASSAFKQMLSEETTIDISKQFSEIKVLSLEAYSKNLSNKSRHRELFEHLLNFSDQVREAKVRTQTLFSACHFAAFFNHVLNHIITPSTGPFNFISATRIDNAVPPDLGIHLTEFLQNIRTPQKLLQFAIPMIASSLLQDAYPPDMHFFNPAEVFCTLYEEVCHQVCRAGVLVHEGSTHIMLPSGFIRLLEDEFVRQVDAFAQAPNTSSSTWHQQNVRALKREWLTVHSKNSCFMCMAARPPYRMPCGHYLCDTCVRRHGERIDLWTYNIRHCFLCELETSRVTLNFKPPTATPRLLSIDGGGVRAIYTLIVLQALQELVGLPFPIYGNFDFIFGTSAGGIIALAFREGLSVEDCIALYERVAKQAFAPHLISSYMAWVISIFTDSIYPTRNLDTALQRVYGKHKTILDCSSATTMGIKIGVVACTMKPDPFLFTNYNGQGDREDMRHEKYGVLLGDALVWEIARSTSAAPGFFTPKNIAGLGKFQDGGLTDNNPLKLALQEVKASNPGDPSAKRSTLKVSLGTGKPPDRDPEMYGSNSWWRDLWFVRLFRALWSSIDGQESSYSIRKWEVSHHDEELNGGKKRRRGEYFRFNFDFRGQPPRLDDSSRIPEMKIHAREAILHSKQLDRLAHCIVAQLFVFELELERAPRKENGRYACTGYILCCHRAPTPEFEALLGRLTKSSAKFLLRGRTLPGLIRDRSSLARDGNFRKRVDFEVTSKDDLISLQLREKGSESFNISGSPFSIQWLIKVQELGQPFGRRDGVKRKRKDDDEGLCKKRQRW